MEHLRGGSGSPDFLGWQQDADSTGDRALESHGSVVIDASFSAGRNASAGSLGQKTQPERTDETVESTVFQSAKQRNSPVQNEDPDLLALKQCWVP